MTTTKHKKTKRKETPLLSVPFSLPFPRSFQSRLGSPIADNCCLCVPKSAFGTGKIAKDLCPCLLGWRKIKEVGEVTAERKSFASAKEHTGTFGQNVPTQDLQVDIKK